VALAASGRYVEANEMFAEARRFGRQHDMGTLLARAIAMSAGLRLDLCDYAGNEAVAEEARELARSLGFTPPAVSAGLDLLLNFARRGDVGRAEALVGDVSAAVEGASGWHGWLWRIRLAEARAEIALARGDWEGAIGEASDAIAESRLRGRLKYQALGLMTRGRALIGMGRTFDGVIDLREALGSARRIGDPSLVVRASSRLLAVEGDDALAAIRAGELERIRTALPDSTMGRRFEDALA
jgi:hypothetical protein